MTPKTILEARRTTLAAGALFCALVAFLVYLPSLQNGFAWDDFEYVYQNPNIRSLDLRYILTGVAVQNWHPLTMLSYTIDYRLWGLDPTGYHLTNIVLHALNTLLVFVLMVRLCRGSSPKKAFYAALSAALLFGLHPIHVESVSWVSERKDVLYAFFYILSVLFYLAFARGSSRGALFYLGALLSFALSLLSKPMAISLPLVLLILDFYPLGRLSLNDPKTLKRAVVEKTPFIALGLFSGLATVWAQSAGEAMVPLEVMSVSRRMDAAFKGFAFYVYKSLLPVNLAPLYPRPPLEEAFNYLFWLSLFFFIALTALSVLALKKRERIFPALWLYYVITLIPVIGIVTVGAQATADRYAYLPGLAIFVLAGAFTGRFIERHGRSALALSLALWAPLLLILSLKTVRQEGVWKDSITLWTHEIRLYPEAPLAYLIRGTDYLNKGDILNAFSDLSKAVELRPFKPDGYYMRAHVYSALGNRDKAIEDLTFAIRLDPGYRDTYYRRGREYLAKGEYGLAIEDFKKAVGLNPGLGEAYSGMGLAYLKLGDEEKAKQSFEKARDLGAGKAGDNLR